VPVLELLTEPVVVLVICILFVNFAEALDDLLAVDVLDEVVVPVILLVFLIVNVP
jgi:hypothetical protein